MSHETVHCERCKAEGRRPLTHVAPVGWLYMQTVVTRGEPAPNDFNRHATREWDDTVITYACTPRCAEALWNKGPGYQLPGVGVAVAAAIAKRERAMRGEPEIASAADQHAIARLETRVRTLESQLRGAQTCALSEGSCKAANCPQHGWSRAGRGDG